MTDIWYALSYIVEAPSTSRKHVKFILYTALNTLSAVAGIVNLKLS
jgi:hypothetical protein